MDVAGKPPSPVVAFEKRVELVSKLHAVVAITEICAFRCHQAAELAKQKMDEGILSEAPLNSSYDELMHKIEDAEAVLAFTRKYIN